MITYITYKKMKLSIFQFALFLICIPAIRKAFANKVDSGNHTQFLIRISLYFNTRLSIASWTGLFRLSTSFWPSPLWHNQSLRPKPGTYFFISCGATLHTCKNYNNDDIILKCTTLILFITYFTHCCSV